MIKLYHNARSAFMLTIASDKTDGYGLLPQMANRHGLITGATGTGKTVTIKKIAEEFSAIGVPVFVADIKGDVASLAYPGEMNVKTQERLDLLGINDFRFDSSPVCLWDVFGQQGIPLRTTVSDMGPLLLSRLMNLNDTQEGVLNIAFRIADEQGLLLLDLKDLRALLVFVGKNAGKYTVEYGNITQASIGAIQRQLMSIESQGGDYFFGEPAVELNDFIRLTPGGKGYTNILASDRLYQQPKIYATFLLWILSELFENLPEVGDLEKPKLVFFFDEAHTLFNDAAPALIEKIEQVIRLVRSKGIGIYFITQNPLDIPVSVLGQLGNRFQHALRSYTPLDQKAVKIAADTFRQNPKIDTETAISQLATGEMLISCLDESGAPNIVQRVWTIPPRSSFGTITTEQRTQIINNSPNYPAYQTAVDRESAYELLKARAENTQSMETIAKPKANNQSIGIGQDLGKQAGRVATNIIRSFGSQLGRDIARNIFGSLLKR
jgi:uncharacterized protein